MGEPNRLRVLTGGLALLCAATLAVAGCQRTPVQVPEAQLARVGDRVITVGQFNRAYEISKSAYPHNAIQSPILALEAQLRLLKQMVEETMLLDQAEKRQVKLTDAEFESALADIRRDYPGDSFEQLLLESAISFDDWKERLRVRLLVEKLIDRVLGGKITISAEEIGQYYRKHAGSAPDAAEDAAAQGAGDDAGEAHTNEVLIGQLRRLKLEKAYRRWLAKLNRRYTVEINTAQWREMTGTAWTGLPDHKVATRPSHPGPEAAPAAAGVAEETERK